MTIARQFRDFEAYPKRTVGPDFSFGLVAPSGSAVIAADGSLAIKHDATGNPPGSVNWHAMYKSIFSWSLQAIGSAAHPGGALLIEISHDGGTFAKWRAYLVGSRLTTVFESNVEGLYIPAHSVRFTLYNSSDAETLTVNGMIKQQGIQ